MNTPAIETFTTTAVLRTDNDGNEYLCAFGVIPKIKEFYSVEQHEEILSATFEVIEHEPKLPNDIRSIDYYAWCGTHDLNIDTLEYEPLDHPRISLIQPNALMFTVQFPEPIFETQSKHKDGHIVRIRPIRHEPLNTL